MFKMVIGQKHLFSTIKRVITLFFIFSIIACNENKSDNRILLSEQLREISRFEHLDYAIRMWADSGFIYFSDAPQNTVSLYNYNGILQKRLGRKGDAPWENGTVWHFSPDEDTNYYWVHDYPKQLLKMINRHTGELSKSMKAITIDNVQYIGSSKFVVPAMDDKTGRYKINLYDVNRNIVSKSVDISELIGLSKPTIKDRLDFILNGNMCLSEDKKYAIHYCYKTGYYFKINNQSFDVTLIKDVRNFALPKATIQYGAVRLNPESNIASSAAADTNTLYILVSKNSNFAKTDIFYIDMYSLKTNKYITTILVPKLNDEQRPVYIAISRNKLIIYYENGTVVIYQQPTKQA